MNVKWLGYKNVSLTKSVMVQFKKQKTKFLHEHQPRSSSCDNESDVLFPLAGRPDKPFHSEPLFNDSGAVGSLLLGTRCSPGNTKALSVQNRIHITRKIMKPNAFHTAAGIFQRLHTGIRSQNVVFVPSAVNWWTINDKASGRLVIVGVSTHTHTHTHTHLTAIFLGIPK